MDKILYQGAEAVISLSDGIIKKERLSKSYRNPFLDKEIRLQRTNREEKSLSYSRRLGLNSPSVVSKKETTLFLEYLPYEKLQTFLSPLNYKTLCFLLGKQISQMHKGGLIHGDLTSSNILVDGKKLFFIDFGLSFRSSRLEDKAVDLLNLKKTFSSTHPELSKAWQEIIRGYADKEVESQVEKIEKRARYL